VQSHRTVCGPVQQLRFHNQALPNCTVQFRKRPICQIWTRFGGDLAAPLLKPELLNGPVLRILTTTSSALAVFWAACSARIRRCYIKDMLEDSSVGGNDRRGKNSICTSRCISRRFSLSCLGPLAFLLFPAFVRHGIMCNEKEADKLQLMFVDRQSPPSPA
jgi:hypothetical protein